jgi:hypothetical protein
MEILMPKKTKSKPVAKRAGKLKIKTPTRHAKQLGVRGVKRLLIDTIEGIVTNVPPKDQLEVAEHVCDIGIDLLGLVTGVDAENAVVVFPDDGVARLLSLIHEREAATQVPSEQIIERLIQQLNDEAAAMAN